jgi:hypothetical protein
VAKIIGETVETMIEWVIAGVVAVGIIVVARAIMTGLIMSRRASHHLAEQTGTKPVPPEAQLPPNPG